MSPPEARLWASLKLLRKQGFHFRRQHPLRGYFLDFVCLSRGLIVEVDGGGHEHTADWDRRRDAAMAELGLKTLRIPASSVRDYPHDVLDFIIRELEAAAPPDRFAATLPVPGREIKRLPSPSEVGAALSTP